MPYRYRVLALLFFLVLVMYLDRLCIAVAGPRMQAEVIDGASTTGGGTGPASAIPTRLIALRAPGLSADALEATLRAGDPPVIARIEHDRVLLDLRTVLPEEEDALVAAVTAGTR